MKVKLDQGAYMPEREHAADEGLDLRARESRMVPAHVKTNLELNGETKNGE